VISHTLVTGGRGFVVCLVFAPSVVVGALEVSGVEVGDTLVLDGVFDLGVWALALVLALLLAGVAWGLVGGGLTA
jgi:hypothetical protein